MDGLHGRVKSSARNGRKSIDQQGRTALRKHRKPARDDEKTLQQRAFAPHGVSRHGLLLPLLRACLRVFVRRSPVLPECFHRSATTVWFSKFSCFWCRSAIYFLRAGTDDVFCTAPDVFCTSKMMTMFWPGPSSYSPEKEKRHENFMPLILFISSAGMQIPPRRWPYWASAASPPWPGCRSAPPPARTCDGRRRDCASSRQSC